MDSIYQHYIIDLSSNNNFVQIPTVQGDGNNIRGFEVELIENGVQYDIDKDDCAICIMGTKPDTSQIVNNCQLTDNGYIQVDITSQMSAVKGRGDYQIVLMSKTTNSQLKSFPFHILTVPATFDIDYIISTDEFQLFTHKITETTKIINNATQAISDIRNLETSVESAEAKRVDAENKRVQNENIRESAEITRNTNENNRNENENDRQKAEAERSKSEENREEAERIRESNENIRIENENTRENDETIRNNAEIERNNAESIRNNAESIRAANEEIRISNENVRKSAETTRESEEIKRDSAENDRKLSEATRQNNESTRQSNESIRQTNTATAIDNAEKATDRANKAAEACEGMISGSGIVMQSEKGSANGVATLDENKKLTSNQLPVATTSVLGGVKVGSNISNNDGIISILKENIISALGFTPIKQTDTTTELVSDSEPNKQNIGDFWLQEY